MACVFRWRECNGTTAIGRSAASTASRRQRSEGLLRGQPAVYPDPRHSVDEERFLAIGATDAGRWILVAFTLRRTDDETWIRPISARHMHRKEVEHYERRDQA